MRQKLAEHLLNTGSLARRFAEEFGAGDAGFAVGVLHDAGKISAAWQNRLLLLEAGSTAQLVDHKTLGS
ncbi:MAG: CRISPR-associated endonuclease Cas3'', partial [Propionibacterium sp.]|nr:CRISPR-associated endonuclease Cas3'' [Propionibacterium sp.]